MTEPQSAGGLQLLAQLQFSMFHDGKGSLIIVGDINRGFAD